MLNTKSGIIESDDIKLIQQEIDKAVEFSKKVKKKFFDKISQNIDESIFK